MTRLWQAFRPSAVWWVTYACLVVLASNWVWVPWDVKALLILSGVALSAAVRRMDW